MVEPAAGAEVAAAEVQVEAAPAAGAQEAVEVAPEEAVQAVAVREAPVVAKAAPVELAARAGEAALAVAATILFLIISTTRPTTSRGQSFRRSRLRHQPISKF